MLIKSFVLFFSLFTTLFMTSCSNKTGDTGQSEVKLFNGSGSSSSPNQISGNMTIKDPEGLRDSIGKFIIVTQKNGQYVEGALWSLEVISSGGNIIKLQPDNNIQLRNAGVKDGSLMLFNNEISVTIRGNSVTDLSYYGYPAAASNVSMKSDLDKNKLSTSSTSISSPSYISGNMTIKDPEGLRDSIGKLTIVTQKNGQYVEGALWSLEVISSGGNVIKLQPDNNILLKNAGMKDGSLMLFNNEISVTIRGNSITDLSYYGYPATASNVSVLDGETPESVTKSNDDNTSAIKCPVEDCSYDESYYGY